MAQCKLNKITIVCEKWKRKNVQSEPAMIEIQGIIELNESEMPPCTCKPKETTSGGCPMSKSASCPPKKESGSCPTSVESGSCHTPGPSNFALFCNILVDEFIISISSDDKSIL